MKRSKIVGLCLAGVCLISAVAVASASAAAPEYLGCGKAGKVGKTYTGKYNNKGCSELNAKGEGKYEREAPPAKSALKGAIGKVDIYLYAPALKKIEGHFECAGGKETGELDGSRDGTMSLSYTSCKATGGLAGPCNSPGQKAGVVSTEPLDTKLVWLNEAETEAGLAISPAALGGPITKVICAGGAESAELVGTMLASINPAGEASKKVTIALEANATTGEPAFTGNWEEGAFTTDPLVSNLKGLKEYEGVPTAQNSNIEQKGPALLVG